MRALKFLSVFFLSLIILFKPKLAHADELRNPREVYTEVYNALCKGEVKEYNLNEIDGFKFDLKGYKNYKLDGYYFYSNNRVDDYTSIVGFKYYSHPSTGNWVETNVFATSISGSKKLEEFSSNISGFSIKSSTSKNLKCFLGIKGSLKDKLIPLSEQPYYKKLAEKYPAPKDPNEIDSSKVNVNINVDSKGSTSDIMGAIIGAIKDFFGELGKYGIKIIQLAVALGVIFIGGKWLWKKTRDWLNSV